MALEQYDAALQLFDQLLAQQPGNRELLINKGLALYLGGRQEEALEIPAFMEAFTSQIKEELQKKNPSAPTDKA